MKTKSIVRKAKIGDAAKIKKIIDLYAQRGIMLFRPIYEIYGNIRDYFVAEKKHQVIGCCSLHILGKEYKPGQRGLTLAEIRSLAIMEKHQKQGVGTNLLRACIKEAKKMEINKIFTLTSKDSVNFFKKLGFQEARKSRIPQKIWQECINCPRFPKECNEVALVLNI
jgi:amino-acid N-acetyltransferase